MTYSPPEIKSEDCFYPNCDGYLAVPFCCKDPLALPAVKKKLAQIKQAEEYMTFKPHPTDPTKVIYKSAEYWIPKPWVGLTDEERNEIFDHCDDGYSSCGVCGACAKCQREVSVIRATETKLKDKNRPNDANKSMIESDNSDGGR
jgi:hypothetical protein